MNTAVQDAYRDWLQAKVRTKEPPDFRGIEWQDKIDHCQHEWNNKGGFSACNKCGISQDIWLMRSRGQAFRKRFPF